MKFSYLIVCAAATALSVLSSSCSDRSNESNVIETEIPTRPEGQTDMIGFAAPAIDTVRVGFIGLGMRGADAVSRFTHIPGTKITAICDIDSARTANAARPVEEAGMPAPALYFGSEDAWKQLCDRDDIDLVYIATDWLNHAPMALYAMEHGKHTAIEVPAALTLEEIWQLVDA